MNRTTVPAAALAAGVLLIAASPATAAEIRVISAAVMKPVLTDLVDEFERTTGHKLRISYEPAGAARNRVASGERFDVIILQRPAAEEMMRQSRIELTGMTTFARSGIALAIRNGIKKPDIGTIEAFRDVLLAAKSISYPDPALGHAAGAQFRKIIERLGIAQQINAKAKLQRRPFSESPPEDMADLAIAQPSEILITPGYQMVDLVPEDLQDYDRFTWTVGVATNSREPQAAAALIRFINSSKAALVMKKRGMEPGAL